MMVTLRSAVAALFGAAALLSDPALAHSVKRNPLSYLSVIRDGDIHTPAHRVHSHSNFDLTFSLHDGRERIRLALHPNHDVIQDDFTVTFLDPDGNIKSSEQVDRALHKVYMGDAFIERPGEIGWSKAGWARITVHRDGILPVFDGVYRIDGDHHHIQTGARYNQLKHEFDPDLPPNGDLAADETMVVWRDSDVQPYGPGTGELKRHLSSSSSSSSPPGDALCTSDSLNFNSKYDAHLLAQDSTPFGALQGMSARSLFGRQAIDGTGGSNLGGGGNNLINSIGKSDGCPTSRKVALVGIATDCTYWQGFNSSDDLRKYVIGMVNQASQVYESTFKISLGIKNLTVLDKNCPGTPAPITPWNVPCGSSTTITDRLNLFSAWRGRTQDTNAYWSLLTSCPTDSAVGLAWRGQLCRPSAGTSSDGMGNNETVAAVNVVVKTPTEWQVFAHETGHTFGAIHDCTPDLCPVDPSNPVCCPLSATECDAGGQYIMNPSTSPSITNFSPCSLGNICSSLKLSSMSSCLTDNKNVQTITGSQCGNGIVEPGEQCDCGGDQNCAANPCCNAETCQLKSGAVCDPSNEDCCTDKCQFAATDVVCRASTGECDVQETCPGNAAKCPDDGHKDDGDPCGGGGSGGGGLKCASGQCTSRDRQCQVISGSSIVNNATKSCPQTSGSCQLSCAVSHSNAFGVGQCLVYGQNFIDGTPCGGGGHCLNGDCKGSSTVKEIKNWIDSHKHIVIPVAAVLGALLLLVIASCLLNCCRRARNRRAKLAPPPAVPPPMPMPPSGWQPNPWRGVPQQHPPQQQQSPPPPQGGYDSGYYPPQGPPPTYMHHSQVPLDEDGWQRPPRFA